MHFRPAAIAVLSVVTLFPQLGCQPSDDSPSPGRTGGTGGGAAGTGGRAGSGGGSATGGAVGSGGSGGTVGGSGGTVGGTGGSSPGSGGTPGSGGGAGPGTGGSGTGGTGSGGAPGGSPDVGGGTDAMGDPKFSFFVISMKALVTLSGRPDGFGGDLRFGQATGLAGADELCKQAAEMGSKGAGQKTWRAMLSATTGPGGMPVHARDRIGPGPWFDFHGRMIAPDLNSLFGGERPPAVAMVANDLPNERGEPNHFVGTSGYTPGRAVDNHDTLTGSDNMGRLRSMTPASTCGDWTSLTGSGIAIGHSWPRSATSGRNWAYDHNAPGCARGFDRTLGGAGTGGCVGCSGGYGGFYCFAVP